MTAPDIGLLLVFGECGPDVSEAEFQDWYDNEHVPIVLAVPGFSSATRYKSIDPTPPSWLALYNLTTLELTDTFESIDSNGSTRENSIISRALTLNRRVYKHLVTLSNPSFTSQSPAAKFVLVAGLEPTPENDEEFNRWYAEEHLEMLSKVPGFLRARRFKLLNHAEVAGKADINSAKAPLTYLTLYDWDNNLFDKTPEYKNAGLTPWSVKMLGATTLEVKLFTIHKSFEK